MHDIIEDKHLANTETQVGQVGPGPTWPGAAVLTLRAPWSPFWDGGLAKHPELAPAGPPAECPDHRESTVLQVYPHS